MTHKDENDDWSLSTCSVDKERKRKMKALWWRYYHIIWIVKVNYTTWSDPGIGLSLFLGFLFLIFVQKDKHDRITGAGTIFEIWPFVKISSFKNLLKHLEWIEALRLNKIECAQTTNFSGYRFITPRLTISLHIHTWVLKLMQGKHKDETNELFVLSSVNRVMSFIEKSVARLDQLERLDSLALELGRSHYRYYAPPKYYGVRI